MRVDWTALAACHLLLLLGAASAAFATTTDEGEVVVGADDALRIGIDGFGRRTVDGSADGPYSTLVLGQNFGSSGEYVLANGASGSTTGAAIVGDDGSARLDLSGASAFSSQGATLGAAGGPSVEAIVTGVGSSWSNQGLLSINSAGGFGVVSLELGDGGGLSTEGVTVESPIGGPGSTSIVIEGSGTTWSNTGSLTIISRIDYSILNGATAVDEGVTVGSDFSEALFLVSGPGSTWSTGVFRMGSSSNIGGTLESALRIEDGGVVASDEVTLLTQTAQLASVDGPGSLWDIEGPLRVLANPAGGSSAVSVANGGALASGSGFLGGGGIGSGGVSVRGPGSRWDVGAVTLSDNAEGPGRLIVEDSGLVAATGQITVSGTSSVELSDGFVSGASLWIDGGSLSGSGEISGGPVSNDGLVDPIGQLSLLDDYTQTAAGSLSITLGGTAPGDFDVLSVLGTSFLDGELRVELEDAYMPEKGDAFLVLGYGERVGAFESILTPDLAGGLSLASRYTDDGLVLETVPEPRPAILVLGGLIALSIRGRQDFARARRRQCVPLRCGPGWGSSASTASSARTG